MTDKSTPNKSQSSQQSAQESSSEKTELRELLETMTQMSAQGLWPVTGAGETRPRYGVSVLDWLKQVEHLTLEEFELQMQMYDELG
ncbi:MAG: hypothetical protein QF489_01950 [Planctomycetota bacterium]|nr:hypothetical protein [Planctomycetota bacterium]